MNPAPAEGERALAIDAERRDEIDADPPPRGRGDQAPGPPNELRQETMIINMGPQHPSTHGVLRLVLELDGEYVVSARPVIGYLHGIEKNREYRTWQQGVTLGHEGRLPVPGAQRARVLPRGRALTPGSRRRLGRRCCRCSSTS